MNTTEKYFKIRLLIFLVTACFFISLGYFNNNNALEISKNSSRAVRQNRSCLGNPVVLLYAFIGVPFLLFLGIIDVFYLIIYKKNKLKKILITLLFMLVSFLSLFLLPF
ncbi:hypothetical protein [Tenacibaculum finnmarkense]|uniref:hypothetical protein n=1 Tax=Tenacibaculum finnmarkense TaxID=2781243 RepID=UPI00187B98DF|nr:hypothetical protein [Tenacibaculum finnmarkense]MBE7659114.1 hypothetical protein [Tenacibaculum finnmarkense genomovar finnmarkense]MCG8251205.1 hypothetical protein [Tenacibaculum finnmarkense genomovar finnmarkense]MCG8814319.1 hypothetical protein [Tenacibaculum finnmarkense]MCG8819339.1 hypothetical protein [Tenacibaculum finnmarkense]